MIDSEEEEGRVLSFAAPAEGEELPYVIELWNLQRTEVEKVLARASGAALARAIFVAAKNEHLGRLLILRRGAKMIETSS